MSGDVCYVRLERPLPRRGVRGEALGQPHTSLLQLHSQQVGTYKYYKKYIIKMDQLCCANHLELELLSLQEEGKSVRLYDLKSVRLDKFKNKELEIGRIEECKIGRV